MIMSFEFWKGELWFCEVQFGCGGLCRGRKGVPVALAS